MEENLCHIWLTVLRAKSYTISNIHKTLPSRTRAKAVGNWANNCISPLGKTVIREL